MLQGKSLLNEALSPLAKQLLQEFLASTSTPTAVSTSASTSPAAPTSTSFSSSTWLLNDEVEAEDAPGAVEQNNDSNDQLLNPLDSPARKSSALSETSSVASTPAVAMPDKIKPKSKFLLALSRTKSAVGRHVPPRVPSLAMDDKGFVQIECHTRPFCLQLAMKGTAIIVAGFTPDPTTGGKATVEKSGLVQVGDVLIAINNEMDSLHDLNDAAHALLSSQLPAVLTFHRVCPSKERLGDYTKKDLLRYLELAESRFTQVFKPAEAADFILACIDVRKEKKLTTPLRTYVKVLEPLLCPMPMLFDSPQRHQELQELFQLVHESIQAHEKETVKRVAAKKSESYKRIEALSKQRAQIEKKLDKMREDRSKLHPDNPVLWGEYVELRHLVNQMRENIEKSKQQHFLPDHEGFKLRFGSDGVYIGVGDLWVASFEAKFTVETRPTEPHVFVHLSTPSTSGLKLRASNFKLATEGKLPSFQCDELNVNAQLLAEIPFVYDDVSGWSVPADDIKVKLTSFVYYEREINSAKRGKDHDTVMKLFINRMLPTVVRRAAQNLFCVELGPLLESYNAQMVLSGEIKMKGPALELFDDALNLERSQTARELLNVTQNEAHLLWKVWKHFGNRVLQKNKLVLGNFAQEEFNHVSIRSLATYFGLFKLVPSIRALVFELWNQQMRILACQAGLEDFNLDFANIMERLESLQEYPVDCFLAINELNFRVDLCEASAVGYTAMQRITRQRMDSSSVGFAKLDSFRNGSAYLHRKLARLDDRYETVNRFLSRLMSNADHVSVVLKGSLEGGCLNDLVLEAHDLVCKGPCKGSFVVPLTEASTLFGGGGDLENESENQDESFSRESRTHENGFLVFRRYFMSADNQDSSTQEFALMDGLSGLYRAAVAVKNITARIVFEMPLETQRELLTEKENGTSGGGDGNGTMRFVPLTMRLVTKDVAAPKLQIETGEFAKCEYKAEQLVFKGSVRKLWLKQAVAQPSGSGTANASESQREILSPHGRMTSGGSELSMDSFDVIQLTSSQRSFPPSPARTPSSCRSQPQNSTPATPVATSAIQQDIWSDYLDSGALQVKLNMLTSCHVTPEHMFWCIQNATLVNSTVFSIRHRLSLSQFLQDVGMLTLVEQPDKTKKQLAIERHRKSLLFRRRRQSIFDHSFSSSFGRDNDQETVASGIDSFVETNPETASNQDVEVDAEVDEQVQAPPAVASPNATSPKSVLSPSAIYEGSSSFYF